MLDEAKDFKAECDALAALLEDADDGVFQTATLFKTWTIEDVLAHLHMWNYAAGLTLDSRDKFQAFLTFFMKHLGAGKGHVEIQRVWLDEQCGAARGKALFHRWRDFYPALAESYRRADPERRVAWVGPEMKARSKIIARQMETWAHGQEVFDALGAERENKDRIRNICHLGVTTYSWAFRNRGEEPPAPKPYIKLTAPSGALWEWNQRQDGNAVIGDAVGFAQVVTQTRNVADTTLKTIGETAARWMAIAQCFAGAPEDPPAKGARYRADKNA